MRDTLRKTFCSVAAVAGLVMLTTGCHQDSTSSFNNMTRDQQQKALQGDPEKGKQVLAQMQAKYSHGAPPPGTGPQAPQANKGTGH